MDKVIIDREFITLGQLLKMTDMVQSGGHAKIFLLEVAIRVNGESEQRRGRKLYDQDLVEITGYGEFKIVRSEESECI